MLHEDIKGKIEHLEATIAVARQEVDRLARDVAARRSPTDADRMVGALDGAVLSTAELAVSCNLPAVRVAVALRALGDRVANVGTVARPRWTLVVGGDAPIERLASAIAAVAAERPVSRRELLELTGATTSRISGAIGHLERTGRRLQNLGTASSARWYLRPRDDREDQADGDGGEREAA